VAYRHPTCRPSKILEVVAGGEHAGAAGDDDATDVWIVLRLSMASLISRYISWVIAFFFRAAAA
jgi:hypothetical protein